MKLYHGSDVAVNQPLAKVGRHNLDFGEGFYVTKLRKQAEDWAQVIAERKGRKAQPIVSQQALGQLRYKKVNHQICFVSQKAIDGYLKFEKSTTIDKKED